ncbi:hypothetical protein ACPPVO_47800 [Dactylosporangium sp. McL0621]|uniref:hypothetical protein n=1 Tax=Dactylosporangium sp. McL0621 TaxID=3415678 RepID=UPI003CF071CA
MQTRRDRGNRRAGRVVLLLAAAVFLAAGAAAAGQAIDDARGATVDAAVVRIMTDVPGRRVYEVTFVDATGRTCESRVDTGSNPPAREISVGGRSLVHYSASDPCGKVRESIVAPPWFFVVIAGVIVVVCSFGVWRLRPPRARPGGVE